VAPRVPAAPPLSSMHGDKWGDERVTAWVLAMIVLVLVLWAGRLLPF
jgi:hypothetical protein